MNTSWDDARIFLAVAESGSFSGAARLLGMGQPTISRRVAEFEYQLGQPLFHRGRRGATLTDEGARLLPSVQQMARHAAEFERAVAGQEQEVRGRVRLTAPPGISYDVLVPFCAALREEHPDVRVELLSTVEYLDLARGDAELAIRTRAPNEPGLVVLYSLTVPIGVFAAPEYRARLPSPCSPADVGWICWSAPYLHVTPNPELEALIPGFTPAFASDNYLIQYRACLAGLGAMFLPRIRHPLVPASGLVEIPLDLPPIEGGFHMVCPRSMEYVPRVRAVVKALNALFEQVEIPAPP